MSKPAGKDYEAGPEDFFGSHIQRKIRKFNKKLKEIEELEAKPESELNPSQREKLASKQEHEEGIRAAEELLRSYINAYVDALGENQGVEPKVNIVPGKKIQKKLEKKAATQEKPAEKAAEKPAEKQTEKPAPAAKAPEPAHKELDSGKLRNILNLVHFAQFFGNQGAIEDFEKVEGKSEHLHDVYHYIAEFYSKVFSYTEASRFSTNDDKINSGVHELEQYLSRSKAPALKNRSYADLFDIVEKVTATKHFHEKTAEFDKHHGHKAEAKSYQAAIGSEARGTTSHQKDHAPVATKEVAHTETHAPKAQPTQASPTVHKEASATKEHHKEAEPAKEEEKPQGGKKAWHQIDSDEEEEGEAAEEQAPAQEKAPEKTSPEKKERPERKKREWEEKPKPTGEPEVDEDGFIIVRSAKEKKEAQLAAERAQRGGRGGRRGGRGGQGGGRGGPRRGGPRPPREGHEGGEGEGQEGGEYRERRGGGQWRPKTEGGQEGGEGGRPWRGGRGGGDRPWRGRGGPREEGKPEFQEKTAPAPTGGN